MLRSFMFSASVLAFATAAAAQTPQSPPPPPAATPGSPTPTEESPTTGPASPQDAAAPSTDVAAQPAAQNPAADIVVTGSRVSNGNNSPTPLTVLPTDQFQKLQPGTVTEAVNLLPALQGSQNVTSRPGGGQRNGAGAYFNLRNMGNLRTLVLYDNQRLIPTINQNEGDTDASIIPQLLIKRVDVVTGGVSAVYGSDAISGVINFVTDKDFTGLKLQSSEGISTYGDDNIFDVGGAYGTKFAGGRGHFEVSFEHHEDPGILSRDSTGRAFFDKQTSAAGTGTVVGGVAQPYTNFDHYEQSNLTYGGLLVNTGANGALRDLMFTPSGTLTPFVHGLIPVRDGNGGITFIQGTTANASTGVPTNTESGGSGVYNLNTSLKAGVKFNQAFGRVDYELTDSINFYAQIAYTDEHTFVNYQSPNLTNLRVSYGNPYLDTALAPAALAALGLTPAQVAAVQAARANPNSNLTFGRFILNQPRADQYTTAYIGYAGFDGTLGKFKWNLNYGKSQSTIKAVNQYNVDNGNLYAALDAVRNASGQIVCRAASTHPGCVPINLFGDGQASQAALDYIYKQTYIINRTRQDDVNGSITGAPFDTWAGPVNMALSGDYRSLRWNVKSNATPNDLANCSGVNYTGYANGTSGTVGTFASGACIPGRTLEWFYTTMSPLSTVTQNVAEAAYEVDVPLLSNTRFAQAFNVTGAVRYTHYNTSGGAWTWKVGGDWAVNSSIRFRATRSRDIRAPNLFELYSPTQRNPTIQINNDPLLINGTPATPNGTNIVNVQSANSGLVPEKANTFTAGVVLKPGFLPRFSVSVDYFKISVDDAIFLLQGFSTPVLKLCASAAAPAICSTEQLVIRDTVTQAITQTSSTYLNIASFKTWGIDTEANYSFDIANHPLSLRALVSYQPKLTFDQGPAGVLQAAGTYNTGTNRVAAAPKWKVTAVASYDFTDNINLTVLERWRSRLAANADPTVLVSEPTLPSLAYTNANLTFKGTGALGAYEFYFNVANLFNKFPKVYYTSTANGLNQGLPEGDDPIGRYFTVGARLKL